MGLGAAGAALSRTVVGVQRQQLLQPVAQSRLLVVERADLATLAGWFALEAGDRAAAGRAFAAAKADYAATAELGVAPATPLAEFYAVQLNAAK